MGVLVLLRSWTKIKNECVVVCLCYHGCCYVGVLSDFKLFVFV